MKVLRKVVGIIAAIAIVAVGLLGVTSSRAQASSKPDVIKHTLTFSYNHSCDKANGRIYANVSKKAKANTTLCMGKVSSEMYGFPMSMTFIINKASKAGSTARTNIMLQLSPKKSKKWKYDTVTAKPFAVGWNYAGGGVHYDYVSYRWFKNLATKNMVVRGQFLIYSRDNSTGYTTVFNAEFRLKIYFKSKS